MHMHKIACFTFAAAAALSPLAASAQAAAKPEPDFTFTGNMALSSEYLYRGLAQTNRKPAISGGFDFAHKSGFYLGNWNSSISWISDANPGLSAPVEMDFYGGYKFEVVKDFTLDLGVLTYYYPMSGAKPVVSPNTTEVYLAGTYGPATLKYSHATTNLFGFDDSKNSHYLDLSATFDVGSGVTLVPHIGYQKVKNYSDCDYTDYSLKASYDLAGWTLSGLASGTNTKKVCYTGPVNNTDLGATRLVVSIGKSF
jgi:uncharacterized protein (TIGR02001 family)